MHLESVCFCQGRVSALLYRGFVLILQKNPEHEPVCDQQQRHDERGNEVGRSQLPWRQAGGVGLIEGVHEIDGTPDAEDPRQDQAGCTTE